MNDLKKQKIITHNLSVITRKKFLEVIKKFSFSQKSHYICITPVHAIIEAYKNEKFEKIVNDSDLALPDGRPVFWALRLLNNNEAEYFPGYYVTKQICKMAVENKIKVGFYGGEIKVLNKCVEVLKNEFKELDVNYVYSPPFRLLDNNEKSEIIKDINKSEIKFLFVSLGCPKQEYWMAEHKKNFQCTSVGIGAGVDWISGNKYIPPLWVQKIGLFWLVRLISEPKRLFWRYFSTNLKFIYLFFKQYLKFKLYKNIN